MLVAKKLLLPHINYSEEMAVIAAAMTGACLGFLWFNCNPARVFMGDTGSLALGGLIGYIAIVIRQEFMLFFVGGIFVIEALSVMLQVGYFKYTRMRYGEGRRIFLCRPAAPSFPAQGVDRIAGGRALLAHQRHAGGDGAGDGETAVRSPSARCSRRSAFWLDHRYVTSRHRHGTATVLDVHRLSVIVVASFDKNACQSGRLRPITPSSWTLPSTACATATC